MNLAKRAAAAKAAREASISTHSEVPTNLKSDEARPTEGFLEIGSQ